MNNNKPQRYSINDLKKLARKRLIECGSVNFPHCEPSQMSEICNKNYLDVKDEIDRVIFVNL